MASWQQNKDFQGTILPQYPLDEAIEWIQKNMEPEEVFSEKQLTQWAEDMGYEKEEGK